jgi:FKBP-type peptidyl-prolyl cis-trans isomerase
MNRTLIGSLAALLCFGCTTSATETKEEHATAHAAATDVKEHSRPYDSKAPNDQTKSADIPTAPRGPQVPAPADVAAPPPDAKKTASGLAYKVLSEGTGTEHPTENDSVKVSYTGWTTDGATFDTTDGKPPRTFAVGKVIPGWTEAMQLMKVGDKMRFWIPEELAYKGRKGAPQGMLVFDVELVEVVAAPKTPEDVAAPPADAKKTKSGLAYKVLAEGDGKDKPRAWDRVKVDYTGWTSDGNMFDSSVAKGRPATFEVGKVIPGWTEALQLMTAGDTMRFWIPEELAYKGKPGPQGMLVFDVKLLEVEKLPEPPPPPPVPKDVAAPPKNAKTTESGIAYKVLEKGKGADHPTADSTVEVHYSGWTTDGEMFDSSIVRGQPAKFPLKRVIKGWTEGVQLMVVGEKTRFWIPKELAYNDQPGKPAGMLVFDIELLAIEPGK